MDNSIFSPTVLFQLAEIPFLLVGVVVAIRSALAFRNSDGPLDRQKLARGMMFLACGFVVMAVGHLAMQAQQLLGVDVIAAVAGRSLAPFLWYATLVLTWALSCWGFYGILSATVEAKLQHDTQALRQAAHRDALTGTLNRRGFELEFARVTDTALRSGQEMTVLMLDLDRFKTINDRFGHAVGDQVLRQAAGQLQSCLRQTSVVARYGGEEFCVLLPKTGLEGARSVAERIRLAVESLEVDCENGSARITTSIGAAFLGRDGSDLESLVQVADLRLYRAKKSGRNRVALTETETYPPPADEASGRPSKTIDPAVLAEPSSV